MAEIIPALMPKTYEDIERYAEKLNGLVSVIQLDIMDGVFVPEKTWPYAEYENSPEAVLPSGGGVAFEMDLMVARPEPELSAWSAAGAARVIAHIESIGSANDFAAEAKRARERASGKILEVGIALNIETPVEKLAPLMDDIDFVQCMGIAKIGYQGQPFDKRVLHKIKDLRERYPGIIITVDGGVNLETAPDLIRAGADRLVSGSAILRSENIREIIASFQSL